MQSITETGLAAMLAAGAGVAVEPAATPVAIPDTALLQPGDLDGGTLTDVPDDLRPDLRPPMPCPGMVRYPGTPALARTAGGVFGLHDEPTIVLEHVAVYSGRDAARYTRALRNAITRCPAFHRCSRGIRWTVLDRAVAGEDSMLIAQARPAEDYVGNPIISTNYLLVARRGAVVLTLADVGWETGDGREAVIRALADATVARLAETGR